MRQASAEERNLPAPLSVREKKKGNPEAAFDFSNIASYSRQVKSMRSIAG
jgi:hypothetical protein